MARRASVAKLVYDFGIPDVISHIIANYANWTDIERTNEMFRVNNRRILKFTDFETGYSVKFKLTDLNHVHVYGSIFEPILININYGTLIEFIYKITSGTADPSYWIKSGTKNIFNKLQQQMIDLWHSL